MVALDLVRLNVGCGDFPMRGWVNVDEAPDSLADIKVHIPPLPYDDNSVAEIYGGHFFEHLDRTDAADFLDEAYRVLVPGGRIGLMVPDTREIMRRYVMDEPAPLEWPEGTMRDLRDLDQACEAVIFSTMQPSHHQWCYDAFTLSRAFLRAGFEVVGEFNRWHDRRVAVGAWYQVGIDARKPGGDR